MMELLNPPLNHPVAYHERSYESDSGFSADDFSSVDPVAAASEITSVASRASKHKSVLKLNTRDDGTIITLDEKEVLADNVQDHGIEDDSGDGVEFEKDVDRQNPLAVSFQEDAEVQYVRTRREQKQSIHFVTRRIKASWLDNTYQKAISRARARLAKGNWPQYPEEWRLPKAPLPARPDLTRTGPISSLQGGYLETKRNRKERRKRSETFPRTKSDSKSAEKQSLLPPIDALYDSLFANLSASYPSHLLRKRWETAAAASSSTSTSVSSDPNSTNYLPFIGTAHLHPKELTHTVRRDDSSQPPKFCYGCAAEIDNHAGIKAPLFFLDNPADDANDDPGSIEHAQLVPQDSPSQQHVARVCYGCSLGKLPHIHVVKPRRVGGGYTMVRQAIEPYVGDTVKDGGSPQPSSYISADMSFDDDDVESQFDMEVEEEEKAMLDYFNIAKLAEPTLPLPSIPREKPRPVPQCIMEKIRARDIKAVSFHEQHCYACKEALKHYWPEYFTLKDESDGSTSGVGTSIASEAHEEEERRQEERRRQLEEARQLRLEEEARRKEEEAERRKNLYKPPKAFQIRKTEKKVIESNDPFSTDRNLNVPKSEGFKLKKTEKQTTKFVEHARQETEWKEPRKFELRRTEPKTTSTDWKHPERPERLRPKTPPTPPPSPKGKKPTVPIEPKKREPPAKNPDPPPPPPPKPVEKPKPKPKPVDKLKEPPPQKSEPKPEPKPAPKPIEKPVKEPVEPKEVSKPKEPPKQRVQPEPKQKEPPPPPKKKQIPKNIEPVEKEQPKPVEKEKPKPVEKEKPKPAVKEKPKPVVKEQPKKEPRPVKKQEPPKMPVPAPPRDPNPPPPPKAATPPPPSPPREPSPPPPKEPTPPPPKDPTPEPPPRDPTPPPAPKPKKETKPRPEKKKPQKQKKKSKSKNNEENLSKEYVKIPIIPYKAPDKDPPPPPKEEPRPPPIPDPPVAPIQEPVPPELESVIPLSLPAKEKQPKPKAKVNPPKKTRRAKLPKRVRKEEKQLGVAAPMPVRSVPRPVEPQPVEPQLPPLSEISHPAPAPKTPEEPAPEPQKQPMQLPKQPEPIMWKSRPEYKTKKKKWRKVEASNPPSSPNEAVRDPLDYLAKYCIVHKERVPHYQRIFNSHLRSTGVNIQDRTLRQWMSTTTTDKAAGDHDGDDHSETESMTTEQSSGYGSAIVRSSEVNLEFKSDLEEFQATFKTTPMEVNEDDYVSPMKLSEDSVEKDGGIGDEKDDDVDSGRADSASSDSPERMLRARIASYGINDKFDVEERLARSHFLLDRQEQKVTNLKEKVAQLDESRTKAIADIARNEFLEIFRFDWDPDAAAAAEAKKKKDKKSKKKKKDKDSKKLEPKSVVIDQADKAAASPPSTSSSSTSSNPTEPVRTGGFKFPVLKNGTDQWVLSRMTDKQVAMTETDAEVCRLSVKKQITEERLEAANKQIKELEGEKKMLQDLETKMKENESSDRMASKPDFRRRQSTLFNMMNQEQPYEIETTNVENLLQRINSHLITEKECQYVYHVLDLPQRHRIDFKLFTLVAALSEKISRLDPFIKKVINKINFEALDVKMDRAKELFYLLEDEEEGGFPGEVPLRNLQVELEAGGLKREHADLVMTKFNREGKGTVDFLDFLTYIPLFIDLHENIVSDPLYASKDL